MQTHRKVNGEQQLTRLHELAQAHLDWDVATRLAVSPHRGEIKGRQRAIAIRVAEGAEDERWCLQERPPQERPPRVVHQIVDGGGDARPVRVVPAQHAERVRDCAELGAAIWVGDDHLHVRPC